MKHSALIRAACENNENETSIDLNGIDKPNSIIIKRWHEAIEADIRMPMDRCAMDHIKLIEDVLQFEAYVGSSVLIERVLAINNNINGFLSSRLNLVRFLPLFFRIKASNENYAEQLFRWMKPETQEELILYALSNKITVYLRNHYFENGKLKHLNSLGVFSKFDRGFYA